MKSLPKNLVVAGGVAAVLLVALILTSCSTPTPVTVKETVVVEKPVEKIVEKPVEKIVEKTVVVEKTVEKVITATVAPAVAAPNAQVSIVPVAANATKDKNVLTGTVRYISDTVMGPYTLTIAMGATGLNNVPISVPVHAVCVSDNASNPGKPAWSLTKPTDSKATLAFTNTKQTEFTPDVPGYYAATCNLGGGGEVGGIQVHAGTFVGVTDGKCATCHADKVTEWAKTGHAKIFSEQIDTSPTHYTPSCASCHTTGWYNPPYGQGSGGFWEAMTKANWTFPTWKQIEAGGNWAAAPAPVKNMANIQCEECHGPASDHVKNGATIMQSSMDEGVCNVCHNGGGHHLKGTSSRMPRTRTATPLRSTTLSAPASRPACAATPATATSPSWRTRTIPAAWDNTQADHRLLDLPRPAQRREHLPAAHHRQAHPDAVRRSRRTSGSRPPASSATTPAPTRRMRSRAAFPHYSSAAEMLSDTGGVDLRPDAAELAARHDGRRCADPEPGLDRRVRRRQVPVQHG